MPQMFFFFCTPAPHLEEFSVVILYPARPTGTDPVCPVAAGNDGAFSPIVNPGRTSPHQLRREMPRSGPWP